MAMSLLSAGRATLAAMLLPCAHTFFEFSCIQPVRVRRPCYLRESRRRLDLPDDGIQLFTQVVREVPDFVAVRKRCAHRLPCQDQARSSTYESLSDRNEKISQTRYLVYYY